MFRHILVPIDLSDRNARTLKTALELARLSGARVSLLHVVQRVPRIPVAELASFYRRLEVTSRLKLERAAKRFAARGVRVRAEVLLGEPAGEIVAAAARAKADVVLMGSHRVTPGARGRGLGTTSYKVAILCRCPVLLVK